jgi:hypothetical protein
MAHRRSKTAWKHQRTVNPWLLRVHSARTLVRATLVLAPHVRREHRAIRHRRAGKTVVKPRVAGRLADRARHKAKASAKDKPSAKVAAASRVRRRPVKAKSVAVATKLRLTRLSLPPR